MSFLYDEVEHREKNELESHLADCAQCQSQVAQWRGAKAGLNRWQIKSRAEKPAVSATFLKWGIAALLLLSIGFGFGKFSATQQLQKMRASIKTELQGELQQELKMERAGNRQEMISLLREVEKQRLADYSALREDLETVAVLTEDKIERTQKGLVQVAQFTQNKN